MMRYLISKPFRKWVKHMMTFLTAFLQQTMNEQEVSTFVSKPPTHIYNVIT